MQQIPTKAWSILCKLIKGKALYLSGNTYYRVDFDNRCLVLIESITDAELSQAKMLVLARSHYQERTEQVPVTKRLEVFKLAQQHIKRHKTDKLFQIWPASDGKTAITYFSFADFAPGLKPKLVLPESLLLGTQLAAGVAEYKMLPTSVNAYLGHKPSGCVSATASGLLVSPQLFAASQGLSDASCQNWSPQLAQQTLIKGLLMPQHYLLQSGLMPKYPSKQTLSFESVLRISIYASVAITLYLTGANLLAQHMLEQARQTQSSLSRDAVAVMDTQQQLASSSARFEQLMALTPEPLHGLQIWHLLEGVYQRNGEVTRLQRDQLKYRITFKMDSASEVLAYIIDSPGVANARIDGNVRSERGKDVASLAFELVPGREGAN